MISEMIEEDARRLDDIVADLNKEAIRHRNARDDYNTTYPSGRTSRSATSGTTARPG